MQADLINRVPKIVLSYWIIKIAATTLGETGADLFSMTMNLGYASTSLIFVGLLLIFLMPKLFLKRYHPLLYWLVFTATSLAGTAMCDFMDRTLGLGYAMGAGILICLLLVILAIWYRVEKSLSVENITTIRAELFYWAAFLFANTLGTAVGDYLADDAGLGFAGGAAIISGLLILTAVLYYYSKLSSILLFWVAFVLTRPFGATFGDFLTKSIEEGGLNFGTVGSSIFFGVILTLLVLREWRSMKMLSVCKESALERVSDRGQSRIKKSEDWLRGV